MSTVAYKDGLIACDTQMSNGDECQFGIKKIGRTRYYLFGYVGRLGGMLPVFDWLMRHEGKEEVRAKGPEYLYSYMDDFPLDDNDGTVLIADGERCWTISGGFIVPLPRKWEAIGSGGAYAVGAMQIGADASEAVSVAMALDNGTGGEVICLELDPTDRSPLDHVVKPGLINP